MEKKFYRSITDRKIAGVCGGIAKYFGIDVSIVRVITAILVLFTGIGLVAYIAAAVILPNEPFNDQYPEEPFYTPEVSEAPAEEAEPKAPKMPKEPKMPKMPKEPRSIGSGDSNSNNNTKY